MEVPPAEELVPFSPAAPPLPGAPRLPRAPVRPFWRTTFEKGAFPTRACVWPGEAPPLKRRAPNARDNASASRKNARAPNPLRIHNADARSRRCFKLATATASAARIGIREQFGMNRV
jgi:hypothetical protein